VAEKKDVKEIIVRIIKDSSVTVDTISDSQVLIGEDGLFFDSIDVLELLVEIEKKYGIKVKDNDIVKEKFKDFNTLYQFIQENEKK
jgi:acyl carrier protein